MSKSVYYPGADAEEPIEIPVSCALFRHPQGNALFDTGCHPDAVARWGQVRATPIFTPEAAVVNELEKVALVPADIDLVICSHLHYDHCGCNAFFDKATVICSAREVEVALTAGSEAKGYLRREWDVGAPMKLIDGEYDVFGDGRLTLLPLPGHTPGSMGAHAVLDRSGDFLLAADAVPISASLSQRYAPRNTADVDQYLRSLDEIARVERDGATVLFGHDDAQWQSVKRGAAFYD